MIIPKVLLVQIDPTYNESMNVAHIPGSAFDPEAMPTQRQGAVLNTLDSGFARTAKWMGVRSDVLWRMEQRGWVTRNGFTLDEKWKITPNGQQALARWKRANGLGPEGEA
jgi:hypothetical protein